MALREDRAETRIALMSIRPQFAAAILDGSKRVESSAIRLALRLLAADRQRRDALNAFLEAWNAEAGPLDEDAVAAMTKRYGL